MTILSARLRGPDALPAASGSWARSGHTVAPARDGHTWPVWDGVHARAVGPGILVQGDGTKSLFTEGLIEAFLRRLPPEPAWIPVIVNLSVRFSSADLADLVTAAVSPLLSNGVSGIRLVLSGAGISDPGSPARLLARRLGIDVAAADGSILLVGQSLLYVDARRHRYRGRGGWRRFHPDGSTAPLVALRHPAPPWEHDLPAGTITLPSGNIVESIPAGIWMHGPRLGLGLLSDPVFGITPRDERILLVVGGPDSVVPEQDEVREIIGLLPEGLRDLVVQVGYDQASVAPQAYSVAIRSPAEFTTTVAAPAAPPSAPMPAAAVPVTPVPVPMVPEVVRAAPPHPPPVAAVAAATPVVAAATPAVAAVDDVLVVCEPAQPEQWWSVDSDFYSVIAQYDPDTAAFGAAGARLDPAGLVELVVQREALGARPLLLVTNNTPAGWVAQVLADGLGVPVVAGPRPRGRWWAVWPRRVGQDIPTVRTIADCYPFDAAAKAALTTAPQCAAGTMPAVPTGRPAVTPSDCSQSGVLFAAASGTGVAELAERYRVWCRSARPEWFGIVIDRAPAGSAAAFRVGDQSLNSWALALALAAVRDRWDGRELVLLSDPPTVGTGPQARLLASHLGICVTVADQPLWTWGQQLISASLAFRGRPDQPERGSGRPRFAGQPDGRWWRYEPTLTGQRLTQPAETAFPGVELRQPRSLAEDQQRSEETPTPISTEVPEVSVAIADHGDLETMSVRPVEVVALADRPPWEEVPGCTDAGEQPAEPSSGLALTQHAVPLACPPSVEMTEGDARPVDLGGLAPDQVDLVSADSMSPRPVGVPASSTAAPDVTADSSTGHPAILSPHESADLIRRRHGEHVRAIARLLAQQPGLRASAGGPSTTDLITGLVALRAYLAGDEPDIDGILRSGVNLENSSIAAFAADGLRRLPTLRGPVYRGVSAGAVTVARCQPGAFLEEPAFVQATTSESAVFGTEVEYVIWSHTGRRTTMLELGAERADVVFVPGTRFVVVAGGDLSEPAGTAAPSVTRILLAEVAPGHTGPLAAGEVREHLERFALARDAGQLGSTAASVRADCPQTFVLGCPVTERLPDEQQVQRPIFLDC
ncbi:hypothetical protein [Frankia sp. Cj3]|uniref:hypothetical protein n=1 Tax=Frankia sp. Cj3 TaxID=2880976 RepID=UPI001EF5060C|nr:hypothetical protein [Frankia sp. Cj3]